MSEIELKYAPRKCEFFCMGDCCLPRATRSCGSDKNECWHYQDYWRQVELSRQITS